MLKKESQLAFGVMNILHFEFVCFVHQDAVFVVVQFVYFIVADLLLDLCKLDFLCDQCLLCFLSYANGRKLAQKGCGGLVIGSRH